MIPCGKRAFTLFEVLMSLAILAVLAAILLAVIPQAKTAAKSADCANRLSNISKSLSLYGIDYDGLFPPYAFESFGNLRANQDGFISSVRAYGSVRDSFFCPLDTHARTAFEGEFYSFEKTSYFMGWRVYFESRTGPEGAMLFDPGNVSAPSQLMVFGDMPWIQAGGGGKDERICSHGRRTNSLYADGRVKNEPLEAF